MESSLHNCYSIENMYIESPFNQTGFTKGKSTADSFHANRLSSNQHNSQSSRQSEFEAMARSLKKSLQFNNQFRNSRVSSKSKRDSQVNSRKKSSSTFQANIAAKLAKTLKEQQGNLEHLKNWGESQKEKIDTEFNNLSMEFNNFIEKNRSSLYNSIDKLYVQMLQTYQELKKTTRNLYTERSITRPRNQMNENRENINSLESYGLIEYLRNEQHMFKQYKEAECFYQKHEINFVKLSAKIDRIKQITESNLFEDLNIECALKQFQNYLYTSMKQIQNKIIWDKVLLNQHNH